VVSSSDPLSNPLDDEISHSYCSGEKNVSYPLVIVRWLRSPCKNLISIIIRSLDHRLARNVRNPICSWFESRRRRSVDTRSILAHDLVGASLVSRGGKELCVSSHIIKSYVMFNCHPSRYAPNALP
jgi:hypothetical protein